MTSSNGGELERAAESATAGGSSCARHTPAPRLVRARRSSPSARPASLAGAGQPDRLTNIKANDLGREPRQRTRSAVFDASTGDVVGTLAMSAGSQPGDLAYARGKLYVAEEFGTPPAIAIVDRGRRRSASSCRSGSRPHHVHASRRAAGSSPSGSSGTDRSRWSTRAATRARPMGHQPERPRATAGRMPPYSRRTADRSTSPETRRRSRRLDAENRRDRAQRHRPGGARARLTGRQDRPTSARGDGKVKVIDLATTTVHRRARARPRPTRCACSAHGQDADRRPATDAGTARVRRHADSPTSWSASAPPSRLVRSPGTSALEERALHVYATFDGGATGQGGVAVVDHGRRRCVVAHLGLPGSDGHTASRSLT